MTKKKLEIKGPMIASEFMEMLSQDEDYQKGIAQKNARLKKIWDAREKEEAHIIIELKDVGVHTKSVWELEPNPAAIPVLLKHLKKSYSKYLEESIARALNMPEAMEYWDYLLDLYENGSQEREGQQEGLACTLSDFAKRLKRYDDAMRILRNKDLGINRGYFLETLALSKDPKIRLMLKEFADDPELGEQTRWYLKNPGRRRK